MMKIENAPHSINKSDTSSITVLYKSKLSMFIMSIESPNWLSEIDMIPS